MVLLIELITLTNITEISLTSHAIILIRNMQYTEYLYCSRKHLSSCRAAMHALDSIPEAEVNSLLLDIWYVSGYILEGITVYLTYKQGGWMESDDIERKFNRSFTSTCGVDYFRNRRMPDGEPPLEGTRMWIESHKFNFLINDVLRTQPTTYSTVPYIGDGPIDNDVREIIDKWGTFVRYSYCRGGSTFHSEHGRRQFGIPSLSADLVNRLLDTYDNILQQINSLI